MNFSAVIFKLSRKNMEHHNIDSTCLIWFHYSDSASLRSVFGYKLLQVISVWLKDMVYLLTSLNKNFRIKPTNYSETICNCTTEKCWNLTIILVFTGSHRNYITPMTDGSNSKAQLNLSQQSLSSELGTSFMDLLWLT